MDEVTSSKKAMEGAKKGRCLASIGEDIFRDILSRLPASSFASAACVSCSWNRLCNQILSRPKLLSALSLNPLLELAVKEVIDKVLAEPIRPHFAIACVGPKFCLKKTHRLVTKSLSFRIPIVVSQGPGIIGSDAVSNEFREVKWVKGDWEAVNSQRNINRGIVLIVGFVPGLKVSAIPLLRPMDVAPPVSLIDKFVMDIKDYVASVSGCTSPAAILMFGGQHSDMKPVLDKMDYAFSEETVVAGNECGCFLYSSGTDFEVIGGSKEYFSCKNTENHIYQNHKCGAVAIVFAKDRGNSPGDGEIHFHLALLTGVSSVGPTYKGASVRVTKEKESTWLTARREGSNEKLDGRRILDDIDDEIQSGDLYIGVTRRRKCFIGSEKGRLVSSLAFHEIQDGDEEYLYVKGDGIKTGDSFCFYHPNPEAALTIRDNIYEEFRNLKQDWGSEGCHLVNGAVASGDRKEVCGGLIFSCYGRGESFFGRQHVDSSVFLENFPGAPLAGMFCFGEIGRGSTILNRNDIENQNSRCCLHVYSTVCFIMVHTMKSLGR
ncbi:F-box/LRR-repeat protein At5g63520 isoform X2 [Telopea speciosissima]|uniref:F-box/LRR-repeat protein At5g63520 isoform X2 n=1 Tax=Telopea speciosissima TaxID=54955 RepID=UPI001CC743C0|nr:F-box/LRR-repeat protein At5g63520 isoform X2 [Telopea speciosissima]